MTKAQQIQKLLEDAGGRISAVHGKFPKAALWCARREDDPAWAGYKLTITMPTGAADVAYGVLVTGKLEDKYATAALAQAELHLRVVKAAQAIHAILVSMQDEMSAVLAS